MRIDRQLLFTQFLIEFLINITRFIESGFFNPSTAIIEHLRNDKFSEISKTLYSSAKEASLEFKQTGKFLAQLKSHLEEMVAEEETVLIMDKQKTLTGSPKPNISATAIESKEPSIALFTIIRTDRNMLLACYSHKHISYRIRTIIRKAILS